MLTVPVLVLIRGDGARPSSHPPTAAAAPTPGHEIQRAQVRSTPPVDTVLVFDDGRDGAVAVDFEDGVVLRTRLAGQQPGERAFRLWRLDRRLVVGADRIVAVALGSPTAETLGRAETFVPDVRPDRLWLVDDAAAGERPPTWTLIDRSGRVLHRVVGRRGMVPVRGVPDGLALSTGDGLKLYDLSSGRIYFYVGAPDGRIGDVAGDRVAWCRPGCPRLMITDHGRRSMVSADEIMSFETDAVWLSPDGTHVAAVARSTAPGIAAIRQVVVFDVDAGEVRARHRLVGGEVHGGWSVDGRQFFVAVAAPDAPLRISRFELGRTGFEVRQHPRLERIDGFVALPRTAVDG